MANFKATAVHAVYNVGANTEERIFDTFEEAGDWLELQAIGSGDYESFWANGSTIEELAVIGCGLHGKNCPLITKNKEQA